MNLCFEPATTQRVRSKPRRERSTLTTDQAIARRNDLWVRLHDHERPRWSVATIAACWDVEERTVQRGLNAGREVREALERAAG